MQPVPWQEYICTYPIEPTKVVMGNNKKKIEKKVRTQKWWIHHNEATAERIQIKSVVVSSQANFKMLSLAALMNIEWQLQGDNTRHTLTKNSRQLYFDHTVKTP